MAFNFNFKALTSGTVGIGRRWWRIGDNSYRYDVTLSNDTTGILLTASYTDDSTISVNPNDLLTLSILAHEPTSVNLNGISINVSGSDNDYDSGRYALTWGTADLELTDVPQLSAFRNGAYCNFFGKSGGYGTVGNRKYDSNVAKVGDNVFRTKSISNFATYSTYPSNNYSYMFYGNTRLTYIGSGNLEMPNINYYYNSSDNYGNLAFAYCNNLTTLPIGMFDNPPLPSYDTLRDNFFRQAFWGSGVVPIVGGLVRLQLGNSQPISTSVAVLNNMPSWISTSSNQIVTYPANPILPTKRHYIRKVGNNILARYM